MSMIATLGHRGPDACGVHVSEAVALGHTRLSIIDLTGGGQPMSTADGKLWIVFNGEIFNYLELSQELMAKGHRFVSRSDTETILHAYRAWGEDCVQHFNGQWAFAIWDQDARKLFLSRDRAGVRPLFYTSNASGFYFASEIKALIAAGAVDAEIDPRALDQIFTFWVTLPPRTAFKDVLQLPPGCSMSIQDGHMQVRRYWSLSYAERESARIVDESALAEELLWLLEDATRIRLRSDVPVGAYLSGGIDSAVTTALAKKIVDERLRSFSITFADAEFDEACYQNEASQFLSTRHSSVSCHRDDIARVFPEVVRHAEQPLLRTAPAPMFLLSQLVRDSGFKVVLTGEGADEVLGGYDIFKEAKIRRFCGRHPDSHWRPLLLRRLYPYMENIQRQPAAYLRHFFRVSAEDMESPFFSHLPRWELTSRLKLFFSADLRAAISGHNVVDEMEASLPSGYTQWSHFGQAEYLEAQFLMPGYILSAQGDRMAMAHSVEGRFPFLDYRLMQFAAGLPAHVKMKALDQKHLLKKACRGMIPESILRRPKQPYRAPDGSCFLGTQTAEYAAEMLSPRAIRDAGLFDPKSVALLVDKFLKGRAIGTKDNMALVAVLSTQLLTHQFRDYFKEAHTSCLHPAFNSKSAIS